MEIMRDAKEILSRLEAYYIEADTTKLACIDERPSNAEPNGVKVVGATDGVLDAYKIVTGADEDVAKSAYEAAAKLPSKLAFGGHTDHHLGIRGCGYRNKVESSPELVGAPESVSADRRFYWIAHHENAFTPEYHEEHTPVAAVINWKSGSTLNQAAAFAQKLGTFSLDAWYLSEIAEKLGINKQKFEAAMLGLFRKTVTALAPGIPVLERR